MNTTEKVKPLHFIIAVRDVQHFYRLVALCDQQLGKGNWSARIGAEVRGRVVQTIKRNSEYGRKAPTDIYFVVKDGIDMEKVRSVQALAVLY